MIDTKGGLSDVLFPYDCYCYIYPSNYFEFMALIKSYYENISISVSNISETVIYLIFYQSSDDTYSKISKSGFLSFWR